jgi:electron transport complex protein RnfD
VKGLHRTLALESSPHVASGASVDTIMRNVVYALLPVCVFAVYLFGLAALACLVTAVLSCLLTEHALCRAAGRQTTVGDYSVVITGLLYGLTLPPGLPLWMVAIGGVIGVALGKALFGGLGYNAFNPALVGRAFLQAAFPGAMTTWSPALLPDRFSALPGSSLALPFTRPDYDGLTTATPLARFKFDQVDTAPGELLLGFTSGSTGETGAILILLGGAWLVARNMMNWRIPAAIMLFSGGLMLGAVFMATDMVASPITHLGSVLYGVLIGALVVVIRLWGGMPEGVMYAILLANAVSPHIDRLVQPRVFGTRTRGGG